MKFYFLFLLIFISEKSCKYLKNEFKREGIYMAIYVKDTTIYNLYWLQTEKFENIDILTDLSKLYPYTLLGYCDKIELPNRKISDIQELSIFGKIEYENDGTYHVGGDLYLDHQNRIIVSFKAKAEVYSLKSKPCPNFKLTSSYDCPISRDSVKYPFYILLNIIESKSLTLNEVNQLNLRKFDIKKFSIGECD